MTLASLLLPSSAVLLFMLWLELARWSELSECAKTGAEGSGPSLVSTPIARAPPDIMLCVGESRGDVIHCWCRTHFVSFDERNLRLSWQQ